MIILCHKCNGVLGNTDDANVVGLRGCGCISGWIRGFEPHLSREQALTTQVEGLRSTMEWMGSRQANGDAQRIVEYSAEMDKLSAILHREFNH